MQRHAMMLCRDNVSKLCAPADAVHQQVRRFEKQLRYPEIPRKIPHMSHI